MRIGIDARAAAEVPAGRGRYVRELLAAWPDRDAVAYARTATSDGDLPWQLVGAPDPVWHVLTARHASHHCSAFLSTNSYLTAWFTTVPTAVFVHDLIPFKVPEYAQPRAARIERATIGRAVRRAAALICNSEWTRRDLVDLFPAAAERSHVVPLAPANCFSEPVAAADVGRPYVLATGTLEPRKNLLMLLEAWSGLPSGIRDEHLLVLVGPEGWQHAEIVAAARARPEEVQLAGHVGDSELAALYAGCAAFCFPSRYEGFGLPVLEAMSAGAPVICSNVSSLPEVAGHAALLVDPDDPHALADALETVLTDPQRATAMREAGRRQTERFSWARHARETLEILRSLAC